MIRHIAALAAFSLAVPAVAQTVDAPAGKVAGAAQGDLDVFKGIPYAVPPVGKLRWTGPKPLPRWQGVRQATTFGPGCIVPTPGPVKTVYSGAPLPTSEDCLTLNIWAPKHAKNAPVFFWIYGGALWNGNSADPMYDGAKLAEQGVVVVSINYRLGVLGYLAHPALSAESSDHVSGNYGLLDQIQALIQRGDDGHPEAGTQHLQRVAVERNDHRFRPRRLRGLHRRPEQRLVPTVHRQELTDGHHRPGERLQRRRQSDYTPHPNSWGRRVTRPPRP